MIVKAFDHDSGSNAALTYQILAGNDDGIFSLDSRQLLKSQLLIHFV